MLSASVYPMKTDVVIYSGFLHFYGTVIGTVKSEQGILPARRQTKPNLAMA